MSQPTPQRYCKKADLELALGGASVAIQLLDKDKDGKADPPLVDVCCAFGSTHVAGQIWKKVDISSLSDPFPERLVLLAAQAAAYKAWLIGSENQAVPQSAQDGLAQVDKVCQAIAAGTDTIGAPPRPALDPPASGTVDNDPNGSGISIRAFRQSGFR